MEGNLLHTSPAKHWRVEVSKPREWWIKYNHPFGYSVFTERPEGRAGEMFTNVRQVDDYDRIWRPTDSDYRLPTIDDADTELDVMVWDETRWWITGFENVVPNDTWRRMPRGPGE